MTFVPIKDLRVFNCLAFPKYFQTLLKKRYNFNKYEADIKKENR